MKEEIWLVRLNTGGSQDSIYDACRTEQIAKRQLKKRIDEETWENWKDKYEIDGPYEVLTD